MSDSILRKGVGQSALSDHIEEAREFFRRPVVVHIAIRQREASHTFRKVRSEDKCHTAAAVVAHQIDLIDAQGIEELCEHGGLRIERDILGRLNLTRTVRQQVHSDASTLIRQLCELVTS